MARPDTRTRILDAAETLFAEQGFAETSLRSITGQAEVNLAAVNYHFGSKKALIQAVFSRYLDPFTEQLGLALKQKENATILCADQVLNLLMERLVAMESHSERGLSTFMKLLGLACSQSQSLDYLKSYLTDTYGDVMRQYFSLLRSACPELSPADLFWRSYFMLGAVVFTLSEADTLKEIARRDFAIDDSTSTVLQRMIPFMAAGLREPP